MDLVISSHLPPWTVFKCPMLEEGEGNLDVGVSLRRGSGSPLSPGLDSHCRGGHGGQ